MRPHPVRSELKEQLTLQRGSLMKTGIISLKNHVYINSLAEFGTQPRLSSLDISGTSISSLATLEGQPNLKELVADGSKIYSYRGLSHHPRLVRISLIGAPICDRPFFRIALLVLVPRLRKINGKKVSKKELDRAKSYPRIVSQLLEAGWDLPDHALNQSDYRSLAMQYELECNDEMTELPTKRGDIGCASGNRDEELALQLAEMLSQIGISTDGSENSVVNAVTGMVDIMKTLNNCSEQILET